MNPVTPVLSLTSITKRFGDTVALGGASLEVHQGSVHALLGENGAGKTTLMRVAFGMIQPDGGHVAVDGVERRISSPAEAIAVGLGMVHQHFTAVPAMTVTENVALGGRGRFDSRDVATRIRALARDSGLELDPLAEADALSIGAQQRLEIIKALSRQARVLVLDEPTAVLAPGEARDLLRWMRQFADRGNAVVLITHKLDEALSVADTVTVLRRGQTMLARPRADVSVATLIDAMLGEALTEAPATLSRATSGPVAIEATNLFVADERHVTRVCDASFAIRAGEIVGIAGVEGSGHHHLLLALAGRVPVQAGTLRIPQSIGYVPGDRHRDALILDMDLRENVLLRGAGQRQGRIPWRAAAAKTKGLMERFDIRAESVQSRASELSGGNQQRLVLARELDGPPTALVAEHPTRGLDIRATAFVHSRLGVARAEGVAIVLHTADLDELLLLSDRVMVVFAGQARDVERDRERIGRAMLGVA